jgi:hypothetical protein
MAMISIAAEMGWKIH